MNFEEFKNNVEKWAEERGILQNGNVYTQTLKLISEFGELCDALAKGDKADLADGIGDCAVVCVIISKMLGSKLIEIPVSSKDGRTPYAASQTSALTGILQKLDLLFEQDKQYNCEWGILVRLEAIAYHSDLNFLECCALAWNEIKGRRGFLNEHGVFVKEEDLV